MPLFSDTYVLPFEDVGHAINEMVFVNAYTIRVNVTLPEEESTNLSWAVIIENDDVKWNGPFRVTISNIFNETSSKVIVQILLQRPSTYMYPVSAFETAMYPSASLFFHKANQTDLKTVSSGISNSTKAMVTTEIPHSLNQNDTIEILGNVTGIQFQERNFKVELVSPYQFYLLNF